MGLFSPFRKPRGFGGKKLKYSGMRLRTYKAKQDMNWYVPKGRPYANPRGMKFKFGRRRPRLEF